MSTNLQNARFISICDVCGTMTPHSGTKKVNRLNNRTSKISKKGKSSHNRPEVPRGFQEVKVTRLHDSGPGWW